METNLINYYKNLNLDVEEFRSEDITLILEHKLYKHLGLMTLEVVHTVLHEAIYLADFRRIYKNTRSYNEKDSFNKYEELTQIRNLKVYDVGNESQEYKEISTECVKYDLNTLTKSDYIEFITYYLKSIGDYYKEYYINLTEEGYFEKYKKLHLTERNLTRYKDKIEFLYKTLYRLIGEEVYNVINAHKWENDDRLQEDNLGKEYRDFLRGERDNLNKLKRTVNHVSFIDDTMLKAISKEDICVLD